MRKLTYWVILSICTVFLFSTSALWAFELKMPLPKGAVKVSEEKSSLGPITTFSRVYTTSLGQEEVSHFYEKEMIDAGWKEKRKGVFIKDRYLAVISPYIAGNNKKGNFRIAVSNIPTQKDILASYKSKPNKLSYMPIYPESTQNIFMNFPGGTVIAYETGKNIKEVVFFYESGMLKYGWRLAARSPVTGIADKVVLLFRRGGTETCRISFSRVSTQLDGIFTVKKRDEKISLKPVNKTIISVNYNVRRKIKK